MQEQDGHTESSDAESMNDEGEGVTESGAAKTDREDGGPTSADDADGDAEGAAHGTKPSEFEPHE